MKYFLTILLLAGSVSFGSAAFDHHQGDLDQESREVGTYAFATRETDRLFDELITIGVVVLNDSEVSFVYRMYAADRLAKLGKADEAVEIYRAIRDDRAVNKNHRRDAAKELAKLSPQERKPRYLKDRLSSLLYLGASRGIHRVTQVKTLGELLMGNWQ